MTAMATFSDRLPRKPWCARTDKRAVVRPQATALAMPYIQINGPTWVNAIVVDVDRPVYPTFWRDEMAPQPNFVVQHPDTRTAHVVYLLAYPVHVTRDGAAKERPERWLDAVEGGLHAALGGDPTCRRPLLTKTPGHEAWITHAFRDEPYELVDLDAWGTAAPRVDPRRERDQARADAAAEAAAEGRNCALFEVARIHAYEVVDEYRLPGDYDGWRAHMLSFVEREHAARFAHQPLPYCEVRSVAKSVAKWTWHRYRGSRVRNRGVMAAHLHPSLTKRERQVAGALYVARKRRDETLETLRATYRGIQAAGCRPTQRALSERSRVSLSTVKRYWPDVVPPQPNGRSTTSKVVSIGAYQGQPVARSDDGRPPGSVVVGRGMVVPDDG